MDTWAGRLNQPITLNKYLYVHSEPSNLVDPSGNLAAFSVIAMRTLSVAGTASNVYMGFQVFTGEESLDAQDLAIVAALAVTGGGAVKILHNIYKKRKAAKASNKGELKNAMGLGKFPKLSNGMSNREAGRVIGWGSKESGAKQAVAKGVTKADVARIKQSGLKKKDIKAMRNYYRDFQKVVDQSVRQGTENTPKYRAELMNQILKKWGLF